MWSYDYDEEGCGRARGGKGIMEDIIYIGTYDNWAVFFNTVDRLCYRWDGKGFCEVDRSIGSYNKNAQGEYYEHEQRTEGYIGN
jgi:hypothetical protein